MLRQPMGLLIPKVSKPLLQVRNAVLRNSAAMKGLSIVKPLFQLAVVIRNAFIAAVIKEQTERQTVGIPVLDHTGTALAMVGAGRFRTNALFYVLATHSQSALPNMSSMISAAS